MTDAVTIETPAAPAVAIDEGGMEAYAAKNRDRLRYRGSTPIPPAQPATPAAPVELAITQKPPAKAEEPPPEKTDTTTVDNVQEPDKVPDTDAPAGETVAATVPQDGKIPANTKFEDLPAWARREITTAREQKRVADAKAAQAEAERAKLIEMIPKPEPKAAEPKPTPDQFTSPEEYDAALIAYGLKQGEEQGRKAAETARQQADVKARADALSSAYGERQTAFMADHEDFMDVAFADDVPITIPMTHSIMVADNGPQIAYHLGQNKAEAVRISQLDPVLQAMEIGKLSVKLSAPPPAAPRPAPKPRPITPIGQGTSPSAKSADEMSMAEYAASRAASLQFGRRRN